MKTVGEKSKIHNFLNFIFLNFKKIIFFSYFTNLFIVILFYFLISPWIYFSFFINVYLQLNANISHRKLINYSLFKATLNFFTLKCSNVAHSVPIYQTIRWNIFAKATKIISLKVNVASEKKLFCFWHFWFSKIWMAVGTMGMKSISTYNSLSKKKNYNYFSFKKNKSL